MFYYYFRGFNWLCFLFGMKKPFLLSTKLPCKMSYWHKLWSVTVIIAFIVADFMSIDLKSDIGIKKNLRNISESNDLIFSIIIIIIDFFHGSKEWLELYEAFDNIFVTLKLSHKSLKMISVKFYVWFSLPTVIFVGAIFMEIVNQSPQFVLMTKFPGYLTTLHLAVHLHLVLATLRLLNKQLMNSDHFYTKDSEVLPGTTKQTSSLKYILDLNVHFMTSHDSKSDSNLNLLCKTYDDLSTCIQLLEKLHGKQMLCTIWIMFSNAVIGITLLNCEETKHFLSMITRVLLPFSWFSLCCFADDQLRKEVERTEILIMKHLIDFQCDLPRKKILETFKLLVNTNRLQFTAGNLFHVNYSMVLGTVMNVITYSIILSQLFLNSD